jgi:Icc-related predicted phosphoesterase
MKLLAFSDLHRDHASAASLVERSRAPGIAAVIGAGDFASVHEGLEPMIEALSAIEKPTVLVPGNNETEEALRKAASESWSAATVLHGGSVSLELGGKDESATEFYGLGAGIPVTPWDWSFDLDEEQAAADLADCPEGAVLVVHSPPRGHCDLSGDGQHLGSEAILEAIEAKRPAVAVCGHIHESWGAESKIGATRVLNLGPAGTVIEL